MEEVDLLIIGAGIAGLCACKTYTQTYPDANVLVIDQNETLGGTWCMERQYEGLKTNNLLPTAEYPDYPWDQAALGGDKDDFVDGQAIYRYLRAYAENFGIYNRIRFSTSATKLEETKTNRIQTWIISTESHNEDGNDHEHLIHTPKLMIATGTTSRPFIPTFSGQDTFARPIIHTKDFAQHQSTLKSSKSVTVLGGAKSAYDAVYLYARAGATVDWVIRRDGRGPSSMSTILVSPLNLWLEALTSTRLLTWLIPCTWQEADGYSWPRWFLHETRIGRAVLRALGGIMDQDMIDKVGWKKDNHPETMKLLPRYNSLQCGSNLSIMNFPTDFLDLVRDGTVRVHVENISHLGPGTVHLQTGESIPTDLLFCATGWRYVPDFLDGHEVALDLPRTSSVPDPLVTKADEQILARFPALRGQQGPRIPVREPSAPDSDKTESEIEASPAAQTRPLNLYRFIVPPRYFSSRSIVFLGASLTIRTFTLAHLQSLWATAYLNGLLVGQDSVTQEQARWEATLHAQSVKLTNPASAGGRIPDLVFQGVVYFDALLMDLGVRRWRKGGWREILGAYMPGDYKGVGAEWRERVGIGRVNGVNGGEKIE